MNIEEETDLPTPVLPPRLPEYKDESFLFDDIGPSRSFLFQENNIDGEEEVSCYNLLLLLNYFLIYYLYTHSFIYYT